MIKYKGIIYDRVFKQLKNVEFKVNVLPCGGYCDHHALHLGFLLQQNLISLHQICSDRTSSTYAQEFSGKNWQLVITGIGEKGQGRRFLEFMLAPIIDDLIYRAIDLGKMSMTVKGSWVKDWQKLFRRFQKLPGFLVENVVEVEVGRLIPRDLMDMAEEEALYGYMDFPTFFF